MASGAVIVYVPDSSYETGTLDPHCTLGFFGPAADLEPWQIDVMKGIASDLAETDRYYAKDPVVSGRGVFLLEPEKSDDYKYAYIDLIDWNVFPYARKLVEDRAGFVNREHGFTPHMTLSFGTEWTPALLEGPRLYSFKWASVDVWVGDDRTSFPIEKTLPSE